MTKVTTKPKRLLFDDYIWGIFVDACGGRCLDCHRTDVDLQRGHIQRHADGGPVSPDNLMPLCQSCNGKNNKSFSMGDLRPANWRDRFLKLQALKLGTRLVVSKGHTPSDEGVQGLGAENSPGNKTVMDWGAVTFEHTLDVYKPLPHAPSLTLSLPEINAATEELFRAGKSLRFAPIAPAKEKCASKMKRLVVHHGRENFIAAGTEFLRQALWADEKGYHIDRTPWDTFADNFELYVGEAREQASFKTKREAAERARAIQNRADAEENAKRVRSETYRRVSVLRYPSMPEQDREYISAMVRGLQDNVLAVSDEDFRRIEEIEARYRAYQRTSKKRMLINVLDRLGAEFLQRGLGLKLSKEHGEESFLLRKQLNRASDDGPELVDLERRVNALAKQQQEAIALAQQE
jgi:hypothetical protein